MSTNGPRHRLPEAPSARSSIGPTLDIAEIIATVERLHTRIEERFPGSGLSRRAAELIRIAHDTARRLEWAAAPHLPLRIVEAVLLLVLAAVLWRLFFGFGLPVRFDDFSSFLQGLESATQEIVLIGASVFFVATLEARVKRHRALGFIRELRAMAHIVDMHQLTKDPSVASRQAAATPSSPVRELTQLQLERYLDYCSEMLALISKLAALYAQQFDDAVVLAAVDEVEGLANGLSGKIWQKIMILGHASDPHLESAGPTVG